MVRVYIAEPNQEIEEVFIEEQNTVENTEDEYEEDIE